MNLRNSFWLGSLAILALAAAGKPTTAQDVPGAAVPAVGAPAPAGPNLFSMLLPPPEARERCRQKFCKCEIGKMFTASMAPLSMATGGLVQSNCCPAVKKEDLAKPADSSEGAAARIKKDAEEAAARREAVRYLGTVDCRYWPEAEEALINALRADKIECVRYEAALALQRGCCCTKKIAKALAITIEGSEKDGFPAERSCRVQDAAAVALSMCVFEDRSEPKEKELEKKQVARVNPKEFYEKVEKSGDDSVYENARKILEKRNQSINSAQIISQSHRAASYGLFGILTHAVDSNSDKTAANTAAPPTAAPVTTVNKEPQPVVPVIVPVIVQTGAQTAPVIVPTTPAPASPIIPPTTSPATPSQPRGLLYKLMPRLRDDASQSSRPSQNQNNDIRPVGYSTSTPMPIYGSMAADDAPCFSTANPNTMTTPPVMPTSLPVASPPPPPPPSPTPAPASNQVSSNSARSEQGMLGFVIMDDQPRR